MPGGQIPSQKGPRRVQKRGPKAIQAENGETTKIADSCKDFNDFLGPELTFGSQKWFPNGVRIASSTRKPSESLLERSWSALGRSWNQKKLTWNRSWAVLGRSWTPISPYIINLAIMEREAGDAENAKHCKTSKSRNRGKRSKTIRLSRRLCRALQLEEGPQPTQKKQERT